MTKKRYWNPVVISIASGSWLCMALVGLTMASMGEDLGERIFGMVVVIAIPSFWFTARGGIVVNNGLFEQHTYFHVKRFKPSEIEKFSVEPDDIYVPMYAIELHLKNGKTRTIREVKGFRGSPNSKLGRIAHALNDDLKELQAQSNPST